MKEKKWERRTEIKMAGVILDRENRRTTFRVADLCAVHTTCLLIQSQFHFKHKVTLYTLLHQEKSPSNLLAKIFAHKKHTKC